MASAIDLLVFIKYSIAISWLAIILSEYRANFSGFHYFYLPGSKKSRSVRDWFMWELSRVMRGKVDRWGKDDFAYNIAIT